MSKELISKEQIVPLILETCPSFKAVYDASDNKELNYLIAAELADHLLKLHRKNDIGEFSYVAELIENLHVRGDSYVAEFATIGILESIQNLWENNNASMEYFESCLLPVSKKYWQSLNDFWDGKIPYVGFDIPDS